VISVRIRSVFIPACHVGPPPLVRCDARVRPFGPEAFRLPHPMHAHPRPSQWAATHLRPSRQAAAPHARAGEPPHAQTGGRQKKQEKERYFSHWHVGQHKKGMFDFSICWSRQSLYSVIWFSQSPILDFKEKKKKEILWSCYMYFYILS
jgi:hypothetical protein